MIIFKTYSKPKTNYSCGKIKFDTGTLIEKLVNIEEHLLTVI